VNYGVEGKHYTKNDDDVVSVIQSGGYTQAGQQWQFGNNFINYVLDNESPNKWSELEAYNGGAVPSKSLGFNFDSESVKNAVAACANVRSEFIMPLETGTVDPDEALPKFLDKLRQAGADDIVAEMQKQYDAWKTKE
jgi:putative aldouronate transport system substrate-binding protein